MVLHISAEDVEKLLTDPEHEAQIVGVATTPQLETTRWMISSGTLNVLKDEPDPGGHDAAGLPAPVDSAGRQVLPAPWTKDVEPGDHPQGRMAGDHAIAIQGVRTAPARRSGHGELRSSMLDAIRLAASVEIVYERSFMRRLKYKLRYLYFFSDGLFQARAWLFRRAVRAQPFHRPKLTLPDEIAVSEPELDAHVQGPRFMLTRYRKKGTDMLKPVMVAPGFGMPADCFLAGKPSFVEFLCDHGYEVWLLDYRGSDHLPSSLTQFTLDDLVADFGDAVAEVSRRAGNQKVRIIGHCVASLVTTMMLLKNEEHRHTRQRRAPPRQRLCAVGHRVADARLPGPPADQPDQGVDPPAEPLEDPGLPPGDDERSRRAIGARVTPARPVPAALPHHRALQQPGVPPHAADVRRGDPPPADRPPHARPAVRPSSIAPT